VSEAGGGDIGLAGPEKADSQQNSPLQISEKNQ
jgi:hypothetical protein